jgi:hypothetical protein
MMLIGYWRLALVGIAAAAIAGGGLYIRALRAEKGELEQAYLIAAEAAGQANAELDRAAREAARLDALLIGRERARRQLQQKNERLSNEIRFLRDASPAVRDWARVVIPDELARLLNADTDSANENDLHPPAGGADAGNAGAGDPDPH